MEELSVRKTMSRIGLSYTIFMVVAQLACAVILALAGALAPEFAASPIGFAIMGTLPIYLIAFPILVLMLQLLVPTKQKAPEKQKQPWHFYLRLAPVVILFLYGGNLFGVIINLLISRITGAAPVNPLDSLLQTEEGGFALPWVTIVIAVVIGPIMEELIMRWLLFKKMGQYGTVAYVVTSGIMFGLFHGNLSQFFYAALLGMLLAYAYARTGNIIVPIIIHIATNFMGSVVSLAAVSTPVTTILYVLFMLAMVAVGIVVLAKNAKKMVFVPAAQPLPQHPGRHIALNVGMLMYLVLHTALIVFAIVMPLFM